MYHIMVNVHLHIDRSKEGLLTERTILRSFYSVYTI